MSSSQDRASFWDHLGELRAAVLRTLALTVVCGIVAFVFKDVLFGIVLAPADPDFATYGLLSAVGAWGGDTTSVSDFSVRLINTGLARQFVVHMKAALCAGALCASPYAVYQIFRFVSPALYADERRYAVRVAGWGYVMFMAGVLVSYFLIFLCGLCRRLCPRFSLHVPVSHRVSRQRDRRESDLARLLHVDAGGHVSGVGHRVRDTRRGVAIR